MLLDALRTLIDGSRDTVRTLDRRAITVLLVVPAMLTWLEFIGNDRIFVAWFGRGGWGSPTVPWLHYQTWLWWALNCVATMFLVPAAIVVFGFKQSLRDFGIQMPKARSTIPLALLMYLVVLPFVLGAAMAPAFQRAYPLFKGAGLSLELFLAWEAIYLAQFFALEFFFRGFVVFGLERSIGGLAVFVSTIPYCMVHFHKPMAEAYAAIVAGVILGFVSMRTRSIWSGFMVHGMVAVTMDLLALKLRGVF